MYLTQTEANHPGIAILANTFQQDLAKLKEANHLLESIGKKLEVDIDADIKAELAALKELPVTLFIQLMAQVSAERYAAKSNPFTNFFLKAPKHPLRGNLEHDQRESLDELYQAFLKRLDILTKALLTKQISQSKHAEAFKGFRGVEAKTLHSVDLVGAAKKIEDACTNIEFASTPAFLALSLLPFCQVNFSQRAATSPHTSGEESIKAGLVRVATRFATHAITNEDFDSRFPKEAFESRLGRVLTILMTDALETNNTALAEQLNQVVTEHRLELCVTNSIDSALQLSAVANSM